MTLKRNDTALLMKVLRTNGGGIQTHFAAGDGEHRLVPKAQVDRLIKAGLVRLKPNHAGFIIHTSATRAALKEVI